MEDEEGRHQNQGAARQGQLVGFLHTVVLAAAVVESKNRLNAGGDAQGNAGDQLAHFHRDAKRRQRNVGSVLGHGPVLHKGIVHDRNDKYRSDLRNKAGCAEGQNPFDDAPLRDHVLLFYLNGFKAQHTRGKVDGVQNLADDGGPGRALDAPMAHKDEDGVQNDVGDTANQQTDHAHLRTAIRPDDAAERAVDHGKGEPQDNNAPVFQGIGQISFCGSE